MGWNTVIFPGLGGISFEMNSIAFTLGPFTIRWYAIIIVSGVLLAYLFWQKNREKFGISEDALMDFIILAIPIGIVGARLYYILFYLDLFRNADGSLNFIQMIRTWDGGMAIYGAVIACTITLLIYCRIKNINFFAFADLAVLGLLIGQAIGRWGNFVNIEAYGSETTLPWRMGIIDRISGAYVEVHPTFLYESLWNLVGLVLICLLLRKFHRFDGISTCLYFIWYGIGRFWIEGLRTDSLYLFSTGIRVSQALSGCLVLAGAILLFILYRRHKSNPQPLYRERVAARLAAQAEDEKSNEEEDDGNHH